MRSCSRMNDSTPNTSSNRDSGILANQLSASWLAWARSALRLRLATDVVSTVVVIRAAAACASCSRCGSICGRGPTSTPSSVMPGAEPLEVAPSPSGEVQLRRDAGALDGRQRDPIRLDVIGMVVAAELVVGDHDLRLMALHQGREACRALLDRHVAERVRTVLVLPLDHARVLIAELLEDINTEDVACLVQLGQTDCRDGCFVVGDVARFDTARSIAELTIGAGDHDRPDALVGVHGQHAPGARRLVVRMSMHGHQSERDTPSPPACQVPKNRPQNWTNVGKDQRTENCLFLRIGLERSLQEFA